MPQGTLALTVSRLQNLPQQYSEDNFRVTVTIAGEKKCAGINELMNFELKNVNGSMNVTLEIMFSTRKRKETLASGNTTLSLVQNKETTVDLSEGISACVKGEWTIKNATQKYAGTNTAQTADMVKETAAAMSTLNPQRALAVHHPSRPKYLRALFYYDTTKYVYNYSTSFRVIASLARFTEQSASAVLQKVAGKNLHELDDGVVVPVLSSLDEKVDATISDVLVKLVEGQNYVLHKKDDVVEAASTVAKKSSEQISTVVETTWKTVTQAKDYTTTSIYSVSSSAYDKACSVTDYATSQVVNVSSSTLGSVRSAGAYLVSHVPYIGAKIRT